MTLRDVKSEDLMSRAFLAGVGDQRLLKEGWHERSRDERSGVIYRPTGRKASFSLDLPGGDVEIIALLSASVTLCGGIMKGSLLWKDRPLGGFSLESENWTLQRFILEGAPEGPATFTWVVENPFIPHEILKNGDFREMGLYVAGVRVKRPAKDGS